MKSIKENYELEEVFKSDLSSRFDDEAPLINEDVKIKKDEFEIIPDHEASLQMLNHDLGSIGEDIDSSDDIWESKEFDFNQPDEDITEGTSFDGTPGFMSPEEIRDHEREQSDKLKAEKERISAEKKAKRKEALKAAAKAKKKKELAREVESKSYYVLADILNDVAGATEDGHDAYDLSEDEVLQTLRSIMSDEEILKKYHELFESVKEDTEQINLPAYAVEYISGYAGNGVNRVDHKYFRTKEEQEQFVKELEENGAQGVKAYTIDNFYHTEADESLNEAWSSATDYAQYFYNHPATEERIHKLVVELDHHDEEFYRQVLDILADYEDDRDEFDEDLGGTIPDDEWDNLTDDEKEILNKNRRVDYPDEIPFESLNEDKPEEKVTWEVDLVEFKDNDLEDYDVVDTVQVTYSDLNNRFNDLATKNIRTKEVADNILLNGDIGQAIESVARDKANVKDRKTDIGFGFDNLRVIENHLPSGVEKLRKVLGRKLLPSRLSEKIVKIGNKYQVQSRKGKNMGTYDTKKEAEKRLKDVEMFKHMNESTGDRYVYSVGVDLSDDDSLILLGEDIAELDDYNLVLYGVSDNGDGTGEMFFAGSLRNIGRYLDNYIGGIQINTDYLVPEDAFEGTVSHDYLIDHPFDLDKISLGEEYRESLINLDIDKSLNEEVIEYDHGTGFVFPNVYDTLQVYCQWEGLLGYEDDIIDYQDTTEEDLDSYLRDEDIYGYTHSLWEILQGKEAYCSDMDLNDFNNVCADLFLDPKDAEVYNSEEVKSVDESVKPDYYELEYTFGKDHYNGEEFTYKVDKFDAVEYLLKDNDLDYLADKLGCEEDEDIVAEKLADHLDLFERDLTDHFSDAAYDAWKDKSGFDESLTKEEVKEDFNIGSNKNVEVGSEPYKRIMEVCHSLNDMDLVDKWNNKDVWFTVEEVYEDYGANMLWKTIICTDETGSEHQILNPREWMDIANGVVSTDEAIKNIMADEYCQFKLKQVNEEKLDEMAMSRADAIDKCMSLGKQFVEHFDKIYNENDEATIKHHGEEMQGFLNQILDIKLKENHKPLNEKQIYDYFITCGKLPIDLFDNETEASVYDEFSNDLLDEDKDVLEALKRIELLAESVNESFDEFPIFAKALNESTNIRKTIEESGAPAHLIVRALNKYNLRKPIKEDVSVGQSYYLKFDSKEEADKAEEIIKSRGLLPDRMSDKLMKVIGNEAGDDATRAILDELGLSYEFK